MSGKRRSTQKRIAEIMERAQRRADKKTARLERERQKPKRVERSNKLMQKQKEREEIDRLKAEYAERLLNRIKDNKEPILRR
jgi:hypothetical protein